MSQTREAQQAFSRAWQSRYTTYKWYAFDGRLKLTNSNSFCDSFGLTNDGGLVGASKSCLDVVKTPLV